MRQLILGCAAAAMLLPAAVGFAAPTAEKMAQQVASTLRESGELSNYRVGVKYNDGVAWLLGKVTSQQQAEAAVRLTKGIEGVNHVVNKLEITGAKNSDDLMLTMLQEKAPKELPSIPSAKPAKAAPASMARRAPRPIQQAGMQQPRPVRPASYGPGAMPTPQGRPAGGAASVSYDSANMPGYAWPSYAAHPNYSALTYPTQYSPSAWPYIGPFYPYPQVPLGWRKVTLEWDDGWWFLDFSHHKGH